MAFLFLLPALICFFRLRAFADPSGADGYFYLKQIESLSTQLHFYYKDYSLAFLPPAVLNVVLRSPLLSYQIVTSCLVGATSWASWRVAQSLLDKNSEKKRWISAAFILCGSLFPLYLQLDLAFLKTGSAVLFFLLCTDALVKTQPRRSVVFAIAALCCHKTMIFYVGVLAAFYLGAKLRNRKLFLVSFGAIAVVGLLASLAYPNFYMQLVTNISQSQESKFSLFAWSHHSLEICTLIALALMAVGALLSLRSLEPKNRWALAALAVLLFAPLIFPDSLTPSSVTSRLLLISIPLGMVVLCFAVGQFKSTLPLSIGAVALVTLTAWQWRSSKDMVTEWSKDIPNFDLIAKTIPADATLYAPHGVEFYLADKTPFRPRSFLIGVKGPKVFRVALVGPYLKEAGHLKDDLEIFSLARLGENYRLYLESDWRTVESLHQMRPLNANMLMPKPDFVADY